MSRPGVARGARPATDRAARRCLGPLARLVTALAVVGALAGAASADEEPRAPAPTIAVVTAPSDRFGLRLRAELEALGFRAVGIDPAEGQASRTSLEASARGAGAIAAIRAVPSERGVEVWIADRVTGKTVLREVIRDEGAADPGGALALRAVELLRASLLEVELPARPPGEVPEPPHLRETAGLPPPASEVAPPPPPRLRVALAPAALVSPGGFGPAFALGLGLDWMATEHVGLVGLVALPIVDARIDRPQGSADLAVLLGGGGARFLFAGLTGRWSPSADLGLLAASLKSTGTASAGYVGATVSAVRAAPFVRAGLAVAVTPTLRLRADLLASLLLQSAAIQFAGAPVATFGQPILLPSLGADFGWF